MELTLTQEAVDDVLSRSNLLRGENISKRFLVRHMDQQVVSARCMYFCHSTCHVYRWASHKMSFSYNLNSVTMTSPGQWPLQKIVVILELLLWTSQLHWYSCSSLRELTGILLVIISFSVSQILLTCGGLKTVLLFVKKKARLSSDMSRGRGGGQKTNTRHNQTWKQRAHTYLNLRHADGKETR